jgi:hypothetical protein
MPIKVIAAGPARWGAGSKRVLVKPLDIGELVFFVTFFPDKNVCAGNGESW